MAKEYGIITEPTSLSTQTNQWEMGWAFTIGSKDVRVVGLRAKLPAAQTVVGYLWSKSGSILASCSITVTAGQWVEANFEAPVTLEANTQYIVSCYNNSTRYYSTVSAFTYNPKIASVQGGRYIANKGSFPANSEPNNIYPLIDIIIDDICKHKTSGNAEFIVQLPNDVSSISDSRIKWECETPPGTSIVVKTKCDNGTYECCTNNGSIAGISQGMSLSNTNLHVQVEMSTDDEIVTPKLFGLTLQLLSNGDDHIIDLVLASGVTRSIRNAIGPVGIKYAGGTLAGVGGAVAPFEMSFTPEGLLAKNNPHDAEHIEISSIQASSRLARIYYHNVKAMEHIDISNIEAVGNLIRVDDI